MGLDRASAASATASLAPGFRFHPTDEELVSYYLKRKICGKPFRFDAISDIDVYKSEPWDLPGKSRLKSRDLEWYFFSVLDKKYGNGSRTNRATDRGYWKTTGKDRPVLHKARTVGMKKTLVYHSGRAPRGERTNWVMHEYRLFDEQLEKAGIAQDAFVLCRIFQKSGSGPKNGEQYGAPFVEEEWEEDELVMVPGEEAAEEVAVGDDAYLDGNDLEQILGAGIPSGDVPLPFSFYCGDSSCSVQELADFVDDAQKPLVHMVEGNCSLEQPNDQKLHDFLVQNGMDALPVKNEYIGESSNTVSPVEVDYLLDEPVFDATGIADDGAFLETNDLSNPNEVDPCFDMLGEYLNFFHADDGNSQFMVFDSSPMMGSENLVCEQVPLTQKHVNGGAQQETMGSQQLLQGDDNDLASTSKQKPGNFGSDDADMPHPISKQASRMLGSIPAPPAFASEFPAKDAALLLSSASHSSSPAHVTAGMIQIGGMSLCGNGAYWSLGKRADVNIILSFGMSQNDVNSTSLEPMAGIHLGKSRSAMSWGWFYLLFMWVLTLSMGFKIWNTYTGNAA